MTKKEIIKDELEYLTGKLYRGDITPIVYDLVKDSNYLKALLIDLGSVYESNKPVKNENRDNKVELHDWLESCEQIR